MGLKSLVHLLSLRRSLRVLHRIHSADISRQSAVIGLDPAHRAGAVYLPLAELSLEFVVPDVFPCDDSFLAADMRSPLISCECSASAHGLSFPRWL